MGANARTRRQAKPAEERLQAPAGAVARIKALDDAVSNAAIERDKAIEMIAVGMGLAVEKGEAQWSYDVAKGEFHRLKRSQ